MQKTATMIEADGGPGIDVDLELVLAVDVSQSMDYGELRLQRQHAELVILPEALSILLIDRSQ